MTQNNRKKKKKSTTTAEAVDSRQQQQPVVGVAGKRTGNGSQKRTDQEQEVAVGAAVVLSSAVTAPHGTTSGAPTISDTTDVSLLKEVVAAAKSSAVTSTPATATTATTSSSDRKINTTSNSTSCGRGRFQGGGRGSVRGKDKTTTSRIHQQQPTGHPTSTKSMAPFSNSTSPRRKKNQRKNANATVTVTHQYQHSRRRRMMLCLGGVVLVLVWVQMMSGSGSGSGEFNFKSLFLQQLMILDPVVPEVQVQKELPPNHHHNNKTIVIVNADTSSSSLPTPPVATNSSTTVADSGSGLRGSSSKQEPDHTAVDDHVTVLPTPGSRGIDCEQINWFSEAETDTACYQQMLANKNCGKRFMTYNTMNRGCACYPTEMAVCTKRRADGRTSWDFSTTLGSPGIDCEQINWFSEAETNTACYQQMLAEENCGKRFMTYNALNQGCACYPTEMVNCTIRGASGRISWDFEPFATSFAKKKTHPLDVMATGTKVKVSSSSSSKQEQDPTAVVDAHVTVVLPNPAGSPERECEQLQWFGEAETDTACYQQMLAKENCGKRFLTYNTMNQGCACYPIEMAVCTLRSASGRISWDLTISKEYLLSKDQHSSTVMTQTTTRNSTSTNWPNSTQFWKDYRLGDYVLSKGKTIHGFVRTYQGTLAVDYLDALNQKRTDGKTMIKPKRFQPNIFCDTVKTRAATLLSSSPEEQAQPAALDLLPHDTDLVIHLRLGDTLDQFVLLDEVEDVFQYGVSIVPIQIRTMINNHHTLGWWHYVKSKCFYDTMLSELAAKNLTKITRVVIVGSALHHTRAGYSTHNSMKYSQLVEDFFVNKGYEVIQRLDGLPDDDMMYLSHASTFVAAGGGFSLLANICVQQLGGTAISHQNGLNQGLEKACATAPYPFPQVKTDYSWETKRRWSGSGGQWGATCRTFPPAPMNWTQEDATECNPPRSV